MKIDELLEAHRNYYTKKLSRFVKSSTDGATELLLEIKNDEPEELFRLYRYDLVTKQNGEHKITEFNADGFLNHDLIEFHVHGKQIQVSPIAWNGVELSINNEAFNFEPVINWALRWLDLEDINETTEDGLNGTIHNVTRPQEKDGWLTTSIDFGSVSVSAAIELLEIILEDSETTCIKLESTWMTEEEN